MTDWMPEQSCAKDRLIVMENKLFQYCTYQYVMPKELSDYLCSTYCKRVKDHTLHDTSMVCYLNNFNNLSEVFSFKVRW